jgi:hypothetical protein
MVVNKDLYDPAHPSQTVTLNLSNFQSQGAAQEWQLAAINPADQTHAAITHLADVHWAGSSFSVTVPAQSVTLFVIEPLRSAPPAPANLHAAPGDGRVTLTWSASPGASGYNVYRATASGGEGAVPYQSNVTSTSFLDTAASNGVTYFFQVTAVNAAGESGPSLEVSALPAAPAAGTAIDAGGGAAGSFLADTDFLGGRTGRVAVAINTSRVVNPAPPGVYQSYRYGTFGYTVPNLTPGVSYLVRLHFAELTATGPGQRLFDVWANGRRVLHNFDIYAAAGGRFYAAERDLLVAADGNGAVRLVFQTVRGSAQVNGIEVRPRAVVAVNAGGAASGLYLPDTFFTGGGTATTAAAIDTSRVADPADLAVYQSERVGSSFSYVLTGLTPGQLYTVRLDFAETVVSAAGQRLFDVVLNHTRVLSRFDVFAAAGGKGRAVRRVFMATADAQGRIEVDFVGVVNLAEVSGIAAY